MTAGSQVNLATATPKQLNFFGLSVASESHKITETLLSKMPYNIWVAQATETLNQ